MLSSMALVAIHVIAGWLRAVIIPLYVTIIDAMNISSPATAQVVYRLSRFFFPRPPPLFSLENSGGSLGKVNRFAGGHAYLGSRCRTLGRLGVEYSFRARDDRLE
jgi:hypothetical protein